MKVHAMARRKKTIKPLFIAKASISSPFVAVPASNTFALSGLRAGTAYPRRTGIGKPSSVSPPTSLPGSVHDVPVLAAPVAPVRAAFDAAVPRLKLLAAIHSDVELAALHPAVERLRQGASLQDIERRHGRLADEARAGNNATGDLSAGARGEPEAFPESERREGAALAHDERVRFGRALENHARGVGVRSARRDERQLAIERGHEHRHVPVLRAIEAAVTLRVFCERGRGARARSGDDRRQQLERI